MSATAHGPSRRRPHRRSEKPRRPVVAIAAAVLGVAVPAMVGWSHLWTSWLWFHHLGAGSVFRTRLAARIMLFAVFGTAMGALVGGNLWLANRMRPSVLPATARRELTDIPASRLVGVPAVVVAVASGLAASSKVETFLAWRNATDFGTTDPWFGRDVSFFVFDYPWWRMVNNQLLAGMLAALVLTGLAHSLLGALSSITVIQLPNGGFRLRRDKQKLAGAAQTHLSVLAGVAMIVWAGKLWLDRFGYAVTNNSLFTGIGYTDMHNRIAAKNIMIGIALVCALLLLANGRWRRWPTPMAAISLMVVSSLVLSGIYPSVMQRFRVRPNEPTLERPYIEANIAATRKAYGIEQVKITDYDARTTVTSGQLKADAEALPGIRLIDPSLIGPAFEQLQQVKGYYSFSPVLDVDRYTIDGQFTDAVVAARELDLDQVPDKSWNNLHTFYTHGYGMVAAYGNRRQASGEPEWIAQQIPTVGKLVEKQSRIYYGEKSTTWSVVGRTEGGQDVELDTPGGGESGNEARTTYDGKGGVGIGNWWTRTLFATRFADINLLLSERVNENSRILFDRTPLERVGKVAPWLTLDQDTYPAVVDGRIVWIVDGYTTSASYPNSHRLDLRTATSDSVADERSVQVPQPVNYVRNAVKAVVDAYDGTVDLYAWDESDPILRTWMKVYPDQVKPRSAISASLLDHMRYPSDLFKLQREVLGRYHTTDPGTWYQKSDLWEVPNDPVKKGGKKEPPNYLSIKWPGDDQAIFSQTAVFVPKDRENLAAYVAVNADASRKDYGQMRVLKLSDRQQIAGPGQTHNAMTSNETVAVRMRNYVQGSAAAIYGNLLTIPVGGGLLYVEPIYTQQQSTSGGYPILRFVVVRFGEHIGIGDTLQQALDMVFKGDAGATTGEDEATTEKPSDPRTTGQEPTGQAAAQKLLEEAAAAFEAADEALKKGDLAGYQTQINLAKQKVAQADKALR